MTNIKQKYNPSKYLATRIVIELNPDQTVKDSIIIMKIFADEDVVIANHRHPYPLSQAFINALESDIIQKAETFEINQGLVKYAPLIIEEE